MALTTQIEMTQEEAQLASRCIEFVIKEKLNYQLYLERLDSKEEKKACENQIQKLKDLQEKFEGGSE